MSRIKRIAHRVYDAWTNERTPSSVLVDFCVNSIPIVTWLILFNTISRIPNRFKPEINIRFAMRLDEYIFESMTGGILSIMCLSSGCYLGYERYYRNKRSQSTILPMDKSTVRTLGWKHAPIVLIIMSWVVLNLVYMFKEPGNKVKNVIAIIFYAIGHIIIVPGMIYYLYLFQPPGILKRFVIIIGIQNIAINLTHILFPNVPPIYIQYYGENKVPDYDSPGYSEGLTRIDLMLFNTMVNYLIFYVKSLEFGIIPSLHSAMSITIFYFITYLTRSSVVNGVALVYLMMQFWSSIYLDHHWRLDIMVAVVYSSVFFTMVKDEVDVIKTRGKKSMGMRLFRKTRLERWFA